MRLATRASTRSAATESLRQTELTGRPCRRPACTRGGIRTNIAKSARARQRVTAVTGKATDAATAGARTHAETRRRTGPPARSSTDGAKLCRVPTGRDAWGDRFDGAAAPGDLPADRHRGGPVAP
ncbi:hypothetical protein HBB16_00485 [Pseudonocardia sp. MCCB 268]|nr:hypothetical protein [Pseudonocardia cytotoxica]